MQQQQLLSLPDGLPTFDEAHTTLSDIMPVILKALENGAYKVSAYHDQESPQELFDAGFAASILRFHSSRVIKTIGVDFQLEDWIEDSIPFMGMSFYYRKYHVRIQSAPVALSCRRGNPTIGMQHYCAMEFWSKLYSGAIAPRFTC
jgi:hypothetical protein